MMDICHPAIEEFLFSVSDHYRIDRLKTLPKKELLEILADAMDFDACKRYLADQYSQVNWNDADDPNIEKAIRDCQYFFHDNLAHDDILQHGGQFIDF